MGLGGSIVFLGCVAGVLAVLAWISDRLERGDERRKDAWETAPKENSK